MAKPARVRRRDPAWAQPHDRSGETPRGAVRETGADRERRLLMALLPLRIFAGATFLYAGLDKFLNPAFLREGGNGSIAQQLEAFTHSSPLTPLIQAVALPHPVVIGALMALAEIAVGLGVLFGVAYRPAAIGGFLIAMLFFLTASWATSPYYFGPDLPYAAGFLTLALVGDPGPWSLAASVDSLFEPSPPPRSAWRGGQPPESAGYSPERRAFLQSVVLGVAAIAVGGAAFALTRLGGDDAGALTPGADSGQNGAGGAGATQGTGGTNSIGTVDQLNSQGFLQFTDPGSGDPAYAVSVNGQVTGYDATCTHQGCPVQYAADQKMFFCPCHGAEFDATHGAQPVAGPARRPLLPIQLTVDGQGNVFVKA